MLFEHVDVDKLLSCEAYRDFSVDDFRMIMDEAMKRYLLFVFAMIFSLALTVPLTGAKDMTSEDLLTEAKRQISEISVSDAKVLFDKGDTLFVDCRTKEEYEMGHIPGAINIPRGLLEFKVVDKIPDKQASIVMYCMVGGRSCLATFTLFKMGYKNVKNMDGGWLAWEKEGYPIK